MTASAVAETPDNPPGSGLDTALQRFFEQSREGVLITDGDHRVVAVNPAFCEASGYAASELLGLDPQSLAAPLLPADRFSHIQETLLAQGEWSGEVWSQHKSGSALPQWLSISALHGANGRISAYVANFTPLHQHGKAAERLAHLAYHDPLTDLPNRLAFEAQSGQALRLAARENRQLALLLIDLDHFKNINDTLGHQTGDALLRQAAQRLVKSVRSSDLVARLGGDEFVVVLPEINSALTAARVASKVLNLLSESYQVGDHLLYATPSIGISLFPNDGQDGGTLLRNAESAMYHAKNVGRNNHQFYASRMNATAHERLQLENALRLAVARLDQEPAEFSLHFQPQFAASTGRIAGLEALLRWTPPGAAPVPPMRFIAIAEETGLIQPIGDWVIREACRHSQLFKASGYHLPVAINISAQQLRDDNLLGLIERTLARHELQPADIELEITESTAMQSPEVTMAILDQLARMGIPMAIDDFGTGYSSLAYLKHLPIQRLKLDRSFVNDIEQDSNDAAICAATIALAHNLGLELVAEGVETAEQRDFLCRLGCDHLQGYLYSRPLPLAELLPYLQAQHAT